MFMKVTAVLSCSNKITVNFHLFLYSLSWGQENIVFWVK